MDSKRRFAPLSVVPALLLALVCVALVTAPLAATDLAPESATDVAAAHPDDETGFERDYSEPDRSYVSEVERQRDFRVRFSSGTVVPEEGFDESLSETEGDTAYVLVQFRAEPTVDDVEYLAESHGYTDLEEINRYTRYAKLPAENARGMAEEPFVRAVRAVDPEWKVSTTLDERVERGRSSLVTVLAFDEFEGRGDDFERLGSIEPLDDRLGAPLRTYRTRLSPSEVEDLAREPRVMWIENRTRARLGVSEGRQTVGASMAQDRDGFTASQGHASQYEYSGKGVRVGVIDSGIEHAHSHFDSVTVTDSQDWVDGDSNPESASSCDHGVHVAGTIAGNGSDDTDRTIRGVAPNATLVVSRHFGQNCNSSGTGVKRLFNNINADVLSNSWHSPSDGGEYKSSSKKIDRWTRNHPGTVVTFCAGNFPNFQFIPAQALAKNSISVRQVKDGSTGDSITANSVRETANDTAERRIQPSKYQGSGRKHPDLYAPGVGTTSATDGNSYGEKAGCSMATPHVSGATAMLMEARPNLGGNALRALLTATTVRPNYDGYGIVNVNNAVRENPYESVQRHESGSVKKVHEPARTAWKDSKVKKVENDEYSVRVPRGAEKLVATLTWYDPQGTPIGNKGANIMINELSLSVDGSGTSRRLSTPSNVKKVVVDDPKAGSYDIGVHSERVTMFTQQDYDLVYRVVTEEPTLSAKFPEVVVEPGSGSSGGKLTQRINYRVTGTGAPVSGVYGSVNRSVRDPATKNVTLCNDSPRNFVVGTIGEGHAHREPLCVKVPSEPGTYELGIDVGGRNAVAVETSDGTVRASNATEILTFRVPEPTVRFEPYMRNVSVGGEKPYRLVLENVSQGVGTFEGQVRMHNDAVGTFTSVSTATGNPSTASINSGGDVITLEVPTSGDLTNGNGQVEVATFVAGGTAVGISNVSTTIGRVTQDDGDAYSAGHARRDSRYERRLLIDGILNVTRGTVSVGTVTGPPIDPDDGSTVTVDLDFGDIVAQPVGSPVTGVEWVSDESGETIATGQSLSTSVPAGDNSAVARVSYENGSTVPYRVDYVATDGGAEIRAVRRVGSGAYGFTEAETRDAVSGVDLGGVAMGVAANERVNLHVETESGTEVYHVVISDGRVASVERLADPNGADPTVRARTDAATVRRIADAPDTVSAVNEEYDEGNIQVRGVGLDNRLRYGTLKVAKGIADTVGGVVDALATASPGGSVRPAP